MKILIAEDDLETADYLRRGLSAEGHTVDHIVDGREALTYCLYNECDLAILDRMLPGMDGISVLKALRVSNSDLPVVILTAMGDVDDRVDGLNAGADDYLAKPFHLSELLARISAVCRRKAPEADATSLKVHDLELDLLSRKAYRGGHAIALQAKEFAILELLMRNPGRILTKTFLLEAIWDMNFDPGTTVVESHISKLRAKIDKPFEEHLLHTIRNFGYSIDVPES